MTTNAEGSAVGRPLVDSWQRIPGLARERRCCNTEAEAKRTRGNRDAIFNTTSNLVFNDLYLSPCLAILPGTDLSPRPAVAG